jgi:hypothetical protein
MFTTDIANFLEIFGSKIVGRVRTHIEPADAEIDRIRSALNGSHKALKIARRSHYFYVPSIFHDE